jgi:predicted MFS family arabinose efflux permease
MAFVIAGLFILVSGYLAAGCMMIFTAYSMNAAITPGAVSIRMHQPLSAVSENATWRDIGAALGTLMGGILISSPFVTDILLIATFGLMILLLIYMGTARRAINLLHLWK